MDVRVEDEAALDASLSEPSPRLVDMMSRLDGDIIVLGIGGKMGATLGGMAVKAARAANVRKKVYGVSRFSDAEAKAKVEAWGIEAISADLLDREAVSRLPKAKNAIYMAGRKFGTEGAEALTWAMNTVAPAYVAEHFRESRVVAFSTGCVYPLVSPESGGCDERSPVGPVGEYAQSCLGRERVFERFSEINGTPVLLFRLNYAVDLRYGVLYDIAARVWSGLPVNLSVGQFNVIWQGDANDYALSALERCASPASRLNITGPETVSVRRVAERFGEIMGKRVVFEGESLGKAYLSDASKAFHLFGYPRVTLEAMLLAQAHWIMTGGRGLGKPTHFEVNDGKY